MTSKRRICRLTCLAFLVAFICASQCLQAVTLQEDQDETVIVLNGMVVEASCGQCKFDLKGDGCELAVRIDGQAYFVDGANIDGHGDAHADDGMCNAIRLARVTGRNERGRFVATAFELLPSSEKLPPGAKEITVEASCGECQFSLEGDGCNLAVRIDGKAYFVDGATIDDFGDAHGDAGMCNAVRTAKVKGKIKDGRFVVTSFKLLPHYGKTQKKKSRLGIAIALNGENVVISGVFENSPAKKAGLLKGDQIIKLNDTELAGLEGKKLIALFKKTNTLRFSIIRDGKPLEFTVKLKPNTISENSATKK